MIGLHATDSGAHFAFTDRWGGVSAAPYATLNLGDAVGDSPGAVLANRAHTAAALGLDPDGVVWMRQVHGNEVAVVEKPFETQLDAEQDNSKSSNAPCQSDGRPGVDGVVTSRPGLVLAVLTADCTPVLLADPVAGVVGAAHAGRPGLLAGVAERTVRAMVRLGAEPERMLARTGPAVCGRCYEVPDWMRDEVAAAVPEAHATTRWGTPAVDMAAGVSAQLSRLGVSGLKQSDVCTLESEGHFSYRGDGTTGRLGSYVWIDPSDADIPDQLSRNVAKSGPTIGLPHDSSVDTAP